MGVDQGWCLDTVEGFSTWTVESKSNGSDLVKHESASLIGGHNIILSYAIKTLTTRVASSYAELQFPVQAVP